MSSGLSCAMLGGVCWHRDCIWRADGGAMTGRTTDELEAWRRVEDEAAYVAAALGAARERARVARWRADDRRQRGEQARLAGQGAFAVGLFDAADAHDLIARRAEAEVSQLASRLRALQRDADVRRARVRARRDALRCGCALEELA
jgi:hypothetical protein